MNKPWHASMHGTPWNAEKMSAAVKQLRNRATVSFVVGADLTEDLLELDARVFAKRPDLILHIWNRDEKARYKEEFLETLAAMKHAAALKLDLRQQQDLTKLGTMKQLQFLIVNSPKKAQNLDFICNYSELTYLELHGKFNNLAPVAECICLDTLLLNCTIDQLDVVADLPLLKYLSIDSCELKGSLDIIADSNVSMLILSSVRNLTDIQAVGQMHNLNFLRLSLSKVERLCDFSKMDKLRQLELNCMKSLQDIENLWSARRLEVLELQEINTAIKAEAFAPLGDMESLQQVDFRFIDFNKGRIAAMSEQMERAGKGQLLYENISEDQRIRSLALEHLAPILT
ncbi:hypothetical protein MH117_19310 [Paenibacillus sp. ACRRX]|uniref:hypothetical protein n=1 Tax=Paenibacillus sp. ACRRX TaxID=2918206 RepID=UPI001EF59F15|nr:hypothetical protein [Paenibacillus sp. ACRRX]MCG7409560.1 hypothetical protein [Paenibacillus sp. ACRRX]